MFNKSIVTRFFPLLLIGMTKFCMAASVTPEQLIAEVRRAATAQLEQHAEGAGWIEPSFSVEVARNSRPVGACSQAPRVEAVDVRTPTRMRFVAICPEQGGWRYELVARARISAKVVIAATDLSTGKTLTAEDVLLERHDISSIPDAYADPGAVEELAARRTIRAGDVLRPTMLVARTLVKRGEPVRIVARRDNIEVSMAGQALEAGGRGATIRVKNVSGNTIRARVTEQGQVEPLD